MGGPGSGNRWRVSSGTCEQYKRVDLRFLAANNMLTPNNSYSLSWTYGDEPSGNIRFNTFASHLELDFSVREHAGEEWQPVRQIVPFDKTPLHFGGSRKWFLCPRCRRRCLVLYGGARFYCRTCYRLSYQTQREDECGRQIFRARKIRRRLGGMEGLDDPFPEKPKGMHWKTYDRLAATEERAQALWAAVFQRFMDRL